MSTYSLTYVRKRSRSDPLDSGRTPSNQTVRSEEDYTYRTKRSEFSSSNGSGAWLATDTVWCTDDVSNERARERHPPAGEHGGPRNRCSIEGHRSDRCLVIQQIATSRPHKPRSIYNHPQETRIWPFVRGGGTTEGAVFTGDFEIVRCDTFTDLLRETPTHANEWNQI